MEKMKGESTDFWSKMMKFSDMCNNTHLFMRTAALLDIDVRLRDVVKNEYEYESQLDGEWTAMEGGPTTSAPAGADAGTGGSSDGGIGAMRRR